MLRWLFSVATALALCGQSISTWAAAGVIGEAKCCCPAPERCKCHDHDGSSGQSEVRRCTGDAERVAPAPLAAVAPAPPAAAHEIALAYVAALPPPSRSAERSEPPEKPPF